MKEETKLLKKGGIGVLATDTLYGIVGMALSPKAVKRIYAVKGRTETKPFIILISSLSDLKKFSVKITAEQKRFLEREWPGAVSIILPCKPKKFEYLHRGTESLAFRMPKKKKLIDLLKKTGPLVAPSANPQGQPTAANIAEARQYFENKVDFYIPEGTKEGKPSKLVSLLGQIPVVLRK